MKIMLIPMKQRDFFFMPVAIKIIIVFCVQFKVRKSAKGLSKMLSPVQECVFELNIMFKF